MLNFSNFEMLTFDCYGTLIDWEAGIFTALKPVLAAHGKFIADDQLLELYGEFESQAETGEYRPYREVLKTVVRGLGKRLDFTPTVEEVDSLSNSVAKWQPWPDTVCALKKLGTRYRLAIISNIDDDLFTATRRCLPVEFDSITTAEQAAGYKPGLNIFKMALSKCKLSPDRILHVGRAFTTTCCLHNRWASRPRGSIGLRLERGSVL